MVQFILFNYFLIIKQTKASNERIEKTYNEIPASFSIIPINTREKLINKNTIGKINKDKRPAKKLFVIPIVFNLLYVRTITRVIPKGGIINANIDKKI